VTAANLAQRELEFIEEQITGSPEGAKNLLAAVAAAPGGRLTDPHPVNPGASVPADANAVDGTAYEVKVAAALATVGSGNLCEQGPSSALPSDQLFATQVTVTVTWEGMGSAAPETVTQVFAPYRGVLLGGLAEGESIIAVNVVGSALAASAPREGIRVKLEDDGGTQIGEALTQPGGCATFRVAVPTGTPTSFRVWLDGSGVTGETYVSSDRQPNPSRDVTVTGPRLLERVKFENYDRAGSLSIRVVGAPANLFAVTVKPLNGLAPPFQVSLVGDIALATLLYPGSYMIEEPSGMTLTVTLTEGEYREVVLPINTPPLPTPTPTGTSTGGGGGPGGDCDGTNPTPTPSASGPLGPVDPCEGVTPTATPTPTDTGTPTPTDTSTPPGATP
jgi:hypothetical protein